MKIQKINDLNNSNASFQKRAKIPANISKYTTKISDKTYKAVSSAIAATGIAGLAINSLGKDYVQSISVSIENLDLPDETMQLVSEGYIIAPALMDTLLASSGASNNTRTISKENVEILLDSYGIDPKLTETLLEEKDEKGNFKYVIPQIRNLVRINSEYPELLDIAKENTPLVRRMLDARDDYGHPSYGIPDIEHFDQLYKQDPKYSFMVIQQRIGGGKPRFSGETASRLYEGYDSFMNYLINAKNKSGEYSLEKGAFRLSIDEISQIHNLCVTDEEKDFAKTLIENKFKHISSDFRSREKYLEIETIVDMLALNTYEILEKYINTIDKQELIKILNLKNEEISEKDLIKIIQLIKDRPQRDYALNIHDLEKISPNNYVSALIKYPECNFYEVERKEIKDYIKKYPDLTMSILDFLHETNGEEDFGFSKEDAFKILEVGKRNPEVMSEIFPIVYKNIGYNRPVRPSVYDKDNESLRREDFIKHSIFPAKSFTWNVLTIFNKIVPKGIKINLNGIEINPYS